MSAETNPGKPNPTLKERLKGAIKRFFSDLAYTGVDIPCAPRTESGVSEDSESTYQGDSESIDIYPGSGSPNPDDPGYSNNGAWYNGQTYRNRDLHKNDHRQ